jgi:hypothetical protein
MFISVANNAAPAQLVMFAKSDTPKELALLAIQDIMLRIIRHLLAHCVQLM